MDTKGTDAFFLSGLVALLKKVLWILLLLYSGLSSVQVR